MTETITTTTASTEVSLDLIDIDPTNVRADLGKLEELAKSIEQVGVLQPVTLRPSENGRYTPTIGNRRCAAARLAGLDSVPAMIKDADPIDRRTEVQLIENVHREDLKPSELARAIGYPLGLRDGRKRRYTQETLAGRLAMSQAKVSKYAALSTLTDDALATINQGKIGIEDGYELSKLARWPERLAKPLEVGLAKGDVPAAVRQQLAAQERDQRRNRLLADLRAAKATLAPDDWSKTGVRLGRGSLDPAVDSPEAHASESCHAAHVTGDGEIEWVCLEPKRHVPTRADDAGRETAAGPRAETRASAPANAEDGEGQDDAADGQMPDPDGEVDDETVAERAERERREAEAREHAEALLAAGKARTAAMRVALERKLNRAVVQRYVSWAYLHTMVLPGYNDTAACELLGIDRDPEADEGTWPILTYAAKGDRELERAALAVAFTSNDEWLTGPWPQFGHGIVAEHYALLAKLGYEPQAIEQRELEKARADADPQPETVSGEAAETTPTDSDEQ